MFNIKTITRNLPKNRINDNRRDSLSQYPCYDIRREINIVNIFKVKRLFVMSNEDLNKQTFYTMMIISLE